MADKVEKTPHITPLLPPLEGEKHYPQRRPRQRPQEPSKNKKPSRPSRPTQKSPVDKEGHVDLTV